MPLRLPMFTGFCNTVTFGHSPAALVVHLLAAHETQVEPEHVAVQEHDQDEQSDREAHPAVTTSKTGAAVWKTSCRVDSPDVEPPQKRAEAAHRLSGSSADLDR